MNLPYLEYSLVMMGEDGIRYTFCAPGIAQGIYLHEWVGINYHATYSSNGARRYKGKSLESLEQYVYNAERKKIVAQMIRNLDTVKPIPRLKGHLMNATEPYEEDFGGFLEDMTQAVSRTEKLRQELFPVPKTRARLAIRHIRGTWWLVHDSWMPLNFDSFEEAMKFAERYILKRKVA